MPIAVIAFDFDPLLRLSDDLVVRWQTVALAAVMVIALILAGLLGRRNGLRPDDMLFIVVGVVPGAVIGARIGYALLHLDVFGADPVALVDPARAGLELSAAVVGGTLTGAYVASLLGVPVGRWAHVAALALLLGLGAGKLTMVLGGSGQGLPSDAAWATAYLGSGPWGSLAPALPSDPSQAYEGLGTLAVLVVLVIALALGAFRRRDGQLLLASITAWSVVRAAASTTWRDPMVVGPFGVGGLLALVVASGCLVLLVVLAVRPRPTMSSDATTAGDPAWPDPAARPPF